MHAQKDYESDPKRWQPLAEVGDATAQFHLGSYYERGVEADFKTAARGYNLAEDYLDGSGVKRDVAESRHWFAVAAEAGYAPAQYKMGWFYSSAEDTPQDLKKAAHWFRLAAEQAEPLAIYALGVMAASGEGLPKDTITAFAYLTVSAQYGYELALQARAQLQKAMTADEVRRGRELAGRWKPQSDSER